MSIPSATVLIVDDTLDNLRVLGSMLESDGIEVRVATSGDQALEVARSAPPDLILLDVMMPGMTGYEVCSRLRQDTQLSEVPVIFLTALSDETDEAAGLQLGAVDYIVKPFKLELVRNRIRNQLHVKHLQDLLRRQSQQQEALVIERTRQLQEAMSRLRAQDAAKALSIRILTRELQGPANGILGITKLALRSIEDADKRARWEQVLAENQDRLELTLEQYQFLSSSPSAAPAIHLQPVRLSDALRTAYAEAGLNWETSGTGSDQTAWVPVFVAADPEHLASSLASVLKFASLLGRDAQPVQLTISTKPHLIVLGVLVPNGVPFSESVSSLELCPGLGVFEDVLEKLGLEFPVAAARLSRMGAATGIRPSDRGTAVIEIALREYEPGVHL